MKMKSTTRGALQALLTILAVAAVIMAVSTIAGPAALAYLPLYYSNKKVCAAKIVEIRHKQNPDKTGRTMAYSYGAALVLGMPDADYTQTLEMNAGWMLKHNPAVGGYFVQQEGGCATYLPAEVFENSYTLIDIPGVKWKPEPARREPAFVAFGWSLAIATVVLMASFAAALVMILTGEWL